MALQTISATEQEGVRQIVVELPESLVKALKIAAIERDTTQKQIIERALRADLAKGSR